MRVGANSMGRRGRLRTFDPEYAVRAALRVFWEQGYEGATLSTLKVAMGGICSPSLYAAFGSKEALFMRALVLYRHEELLPSRQVLLGEPVTRAIGDYLRQVVLRYTDPDKPKGCLVDLNIVNFSVSNSGIQEYLRGLRLETSTLLLNCLERGQRLGSVPAQVDLLRMTRFLSTLLQGLSIQARDGVSREQLLWVVEDAQRMWLSLIGEAGCSAKTAVGTSA